MPEGTSVKQIGDFSILYREADNVKRSSIRPYSIWFNDTFICSFASLDSLSNEFIVDNVSNWIEHQRVFIANQKMAYEQADIIRDAVSTAIEGLPDLEAHFPLEAPMEVGDFVIAKNRVTSDQEEYHVIFPKIQSLFHETLWDSCIGNWEPQNTRFKTTAFKEFLQAWVVNAPNRKESISRRLHSLTGTLEKLETALLRLTNKG